MFNYKKNNNFEYRLNESKRILEKNPGKIPIRIEKSDKCEFKIDKNKYLVPNDFKIQQLIYVIRKRIKIKDSETIFIYINNILPQSNTSIGDIYEDNKDEDGFLYINYSKENTFG